MRTAMNAHSERKAVSDDKRATIGILFEDHLRGYDHLRSPSLDPLDRVTRFLSEKLHPFHSEVRGLSIASDNLVNALIGHGKLNNYDLFFSPPLRASADARVQAYKQLENRPYKTRARFLDSPEVSPQLAGWLNLSPLQLSRGGIERSLAFREKTKGLYPITTLFHGLSPHTMLYDCFLRILLNQSLRFDSLISTSKASQKALQNLLADLAEQFLQRFGVQLSYSGRYDTIPLCVDTNHFRPRDKGSCRKKLRLPQNSFVLLYVGRLSPLKADLRPLLQVVQKLTKNNPSINLRVVLAGTAEEGYVSILESDAKALGMHDQLLIFQNVSDDLKSQLLSAADILVSPSDSLQESFGLTPIEAMASGLPQVVADWSGYRDTVLHGVTGFLVPTYWSDCDGDVTQRSATLGWEYDHLTLAQSTAMDLRLLHEYIQLLISNPTLRQSMSDMSRSRALATYSYHCVAAEYELLWSELSSISQPTTVASLDPIFSTAHYFRNFAHYASDLLSNETALEASAMRPPIIYTELLPNYPISSTSHTSVLQPAILQRLLALVERKNPLNEVDSGIFRSQKQITIGEAVMVITAEGDSHPDVVKRHIMWLIKYGYFAPVPKQVNPLVA